MEEQLHPAIREQFGAALNLLAARGYRVRQARYEAESFGDFIIDLTGRRPNFRIVRDRSEYRVEADPELNPPQRVYRDPIEFVAEVLLWANAVAEAENSG